MQPWKIQNYITRLKIYLYDRSILAIPTCFDSFLREILPYDIESTRDLLLAKEHRTSFRATVDTLESTALFFWRSPTRWRRYNR